MCFKSVRIADYHRGPVKKSERGRHVKTEEEWKRQRWLRCSLNKASVCASESGGQRQSRASSNTPMLLDTMISTECQEQQQLMGSLCVCFDVSMPCVFMCVLDSSKTKEPKYTLVHKHKYHWLSVNFKQCSCNLWWHRHEQLWWAKGKEHRADLTIKVAGWIPTQTVPCLLLSRCGSVVRQAVRMCKHHKTPNPRGLCSARSLKGFCLSSIIPVVRPPSRQGADLHVHSLHHTYSLTHSTHISSLWSFPIGCILFPISVVTWF